MMAAVEVNEATMMAAVYHSSDMIMRIAALVAQVVAMIVVMITLAR